MFEEPADTRRQTLLQAEIFLGKICVHIAWPIHFFHNVSHFFAKSRITFALLSRTISDYIELFGLCFTDSLENPSSVVGTIEDNKKDGGRKRGCKRDGHE